MYAVFKALLLSVLIACAAVLAGCGGGSDHGWGGWDHNPWAGSYYGDYDFGNDNGTLDIYIGDDGKIDGSWKSDVDAASGSVWGDIDWHGNFNIQTEWASAWGHGEIQSGTRVLIFDGYDSRAAKGKVHIGNLKERKGAKPAGKPVGKPVDATPQKVADAPGDTIGG